MHDHRWFLPISAVTVCLTSAAADAPRPVPAGGPLRVCAANPRYFAGADGKPVLLVGSHTWNSLVDMAPADAPAPFDFPAYLDFLTRYGHNFIRLWTWDSATWDTRANGRLGKDFVHGCAPLTWARTGPGAATDGRPRFDLTQFDRDYFARLRSRVEAAGDRGIYVSVMLFEGWGLMHGNRRKGTNDGWAWRSHPFHPDNNVNGIAGGRAGEPLAGAVHSLAHPAVNALQLAYIRQVVDTVNDLDNVLYEVINEGGQKEWDWWVVTQVREYERTKPKQHPIGITGHGAEDLASMLASPADWLSPGSKDGYRDLPPAWDGRAKVSLLDTDHVWGVGGHRAWVWNSFLRGHNPLFMDPYDGTVLGKPFDPVFDPVRQALGQVLAWSRRIDLTRMTPQATLASSAVCLADPGREFLVYLPDGADVTVDLGAGQAEFAVAWFGPASGETRPGANVRASGRTVFASPFAPGDAVLHLKRTPAPEP
jgi:hypothetical protein